MMEFAMDAGLRKYPSEAKRLYYIRTSFGSLQEAPATKISQVPMENSISLIAIRR